MIIEYPFTDLREAYQNRRRIELLRLKGATRIRPAIPEYPHYPGRVRVQVNKKER